MIDEFVKVLVERLEENKEYYLQSQVVARECGFLSVSSACEAKVYAIEEVVEIVNQLAEERKNGWIPVSEALPNFTPNEKQRQVLVTLEDFEGKRFATTAKYDERSGSWFDFDKARFVNFKVVAWQPLPAPYQPKAGEK